jgi:hypothetical protein
MLIIVVTFIEIASYSAGYVTGLACTLLGVVKVVEEGQFNSTALPYN